MPSTGPLRGVQAGGGRRQGGTVGRARRRGAAGSRLGRVLQPRRGSGVAHALATLPWRLPGPSWHTPSQPTAHWYTACPSVSSRMSSKSWTTSGGGCSRLMTKVRRSAWLMCTKDCTTEKVVALRGWEGAGRVGRGGVR